MNSRIFSALMTSVAVVVGILSCSPEKGNGTSVPSSSTEGDVATATYSITLQDTAMVIDKYPGVSFTYCTKDSLGNDSIATMYVGDTSKSTTMVYNVTGDTLRLAVVPLDTLHSSGVVFRQWINLVRTGSGLGIIGNWTPAPKRYSHIVLSGMPTQIESAQLDSVDQAMSKKDNDMNSFCSVKYSITSTTYSFTVTVCQAKYVAYTLTRFLTDHDLDCSTVGCNELTIYGNITKETATLTYFGNSYDDFYNNTGRSGVVYRSSNSSHHTYTVYSRPANTTQCVADSSQWYIKFMDANQKATVPAKSIASKSTLNDPFLAVTLQMLKYPNTLVFGGF